MGMQLGLIKEPSGWAAAGCGLCTALPGERVPGAVLGVLLGVRWYWALPHSGQNTHCL